MQLDFPYCDFSGLTDLDYLTNACCWVSLPTNEQQIISHINLITMPIKRPHIAAKQLCPSWEFWTRGTHNHIVLLDPEVVNLLED